MIPHPKALPLLVLAALALAACAQQPRPRATGPAAPSAAIPDSSPAPGAAQWAKSGATREMYRDDLESCYAFAQARIAHDERIETDSGAAFDAFPTGMGVSELSRRMNRFERGNRRASLYNECMRAKGYRAR